jgi:predicted TIM-barrel fold metal-dependent hydrolase
MRADRREFLTGLATLGAGALLAGRPIGAQGRDPAGTRPFRVDVHHHHVSPTYAAAMRARGQNLPQWSLDKALAFMAENGIATSVLSLQQPSIWFGDGDLPQARRLSREANDFAAGVIRDNPGRFGLFATIPLPDTEGSLREAEYALDTLKADGIGLMTSYGTKWLGDRSFWPVLEELNRRKAVVYTHPLSPACCGSLMTELNASIIEFTTDTARTIGSLLFSGAAARFADIRWVFSHGGGPLPYHYGRFARQEAVQKDREQLFPKGMLFEIRKFYYDIAQAHHASGLTGLLKLVEPAQLMFGTDFPNRPSFETIDGLQRFGFNATDLRGIDCDNALRLLPGLKR